jgi:hypothetical protein
MRVRVCYNDDMIKQDPNITHYLRDGRRLTLLNSYNNETLFIHVDYYFDWSTSSVIHCNSRHGIIYLEQKVDFLAYHDTDRKRLKYVSCTEGLGCYVSRSTKGYKYIVHRTETDMFVLRESHTLIHQYLEDHIWYEHSRVNLEYTIHDNVQTIHDKARTASLILARIKNSPQPRRDLIIA